MATLSAEDFFMPWDDYDITPNADGVSFTIKKAEGSGVRSSGDARWTHVLGSAALTRGRFRVRFDERARGERYDAAVNIGVADAADKPDSEKENYIVWINSTEFLGGREEGFFWNGTMAGSDTGGYSRGLSVSGISPLLIDVIVEDRKLFFATEGGDPVEAFKDIPEMVRPYIFMYGENEVTYFPPATRVVTLQEILRDGDEEACTIRCTGLSGEETSVQVELQETLRGLTLLLREVLAVPGAIDLQIRSPEGDLLSGDLLVSELWLARPALPSNGPLVPAETSGS